MCSRSVILALTLVTILQSGCRTNVEQTIDLKTVTLEPTAQPKYTPQKAGFIDFAGVSTTFDPKAFSASGEDVLKERPVEQEWDKPGENFPKHRVISLRYGEREATIRVLPIAEYRRMFSVSKHLVEIFDQNLEGIRRSVQDPHFRLEGQMPFIPFYDASQEFQLKVAPLRFKSGNGLFFLTEYTIEPTIINNERLTYFYQGITDDDKYYILGDFPVSVGFLPNETGADSFEDFVLPTDFYSPESLKAGTNEKKYRDYVRKIGARLEKWPEDKFQPHLKKIRDAIATLRIEY